MHETTRSNFSNAFVSRFLKVIQRNIQEARSKQSAIYAITAAETSCGFISSCVPAIVLKLLLNQLSKRYSLCLTHVDGDLPVEGVNGAIYWRPPQGNCSRYISLLTRYLLYFVFFIASSCIHFFRHVNDLAQAWKRSTPWYNGRRVNRPAAFHRSENISSEYTKSRQHSRRSESIQSKPKP